MLLTYTMTYGGMDGVYGIGWGFCDWSFVWCPLTLSSGFECVVAAVCSNEEFGASHASIGGGICFLSGLFIGRFQFDSMFGIFSFLWQRDNHRGQYVRRPASFASSNVIKCASARFLPITRGLERATIHVRSGNGQAKRVIFRRFRDNVARTDVFTSITRIMASSKWVVLTQVSVFRFTSALGKTFLRHVASWYMRHIYKMSGSTPVIRGICCTLRIFQSIIFEVWFGWRNIVCRSLASCRHGGGGVVSFSFTILLRFSDR